MIMKQTNIFDEFQISLLVRQHDWSNLLLILPDCTHTTLVSDAYSNIANDLLACCHSAIENYQHTQPFYDEPGGSVWKLTPDPVMKHLVRIRIYDLSSKAGEYSDADLITPAVDFLAKRKHLLLNLMMELWRTRLLYADASFQKDRQEFPHHRFESIWNKWSQANMGCPFALPSQ